MEIIGAKIGVEYIADDSLSNAQKVFDKITEKASGLYILLERGRLVPELKDQGILLYRELILSPWRIIYRISESFDLYAIGSAHIA